MTDKVLMLNYNLRNGNHIAHYRTKPRVKDPINAVTVIVLIIRRACRCPLPSHLHIRTCIREEMLAIIAYTSNRIYRCVFSLYYVPAACLVGFTKTADFVRSLNSASVRSSIL